MRHAPVVLLALALLGAACSSGGTPAGAVPETAAAEAGDSVRVVRGRPVSVDGGRLVVSFTRLVDSRCATNVVCVWEGDAAVTLRLEGRGSAAVVTLHTALQPRAATHAGYDVALVTVVPHPVSPPPEPPVVPTAILRIVRR